MRNLSRQLLSVAAAVIVGSCAPEGGSGGGTAASKADIPIGAYLPLTGHTATFGTGSRDGAQFAADQINARGGLLGRKIRLMVEDDQGKPEEAANVVTKLITQDNVIAVIGENASSNTLAAAPIAQANHVPMMSPSSTNPEVTKKGDYIFRVCFTDDLQGKALAKFVHDNLHFTSVAILQDNKSDYSIGLSKTFSDAFTAAGGKIVGTQSYTANDPDFRAQLTAIKAFAPQAIFVPGYYQDASQIAMQARDLGISAPLIGGDGWESPKLLEIGGKNLDGCYYAATVSLASPEAATQKFVAEFKTKTGREPDGLNALGYDAMNLIATAIEKAGSLDKKAIRDQLAAIQKYPGVTGEISYGPDRNPVKPVPIVQIKSGKVELIENVKP